uniref:Uncharacterized protein n=1 Tax=Oryza barthii TaxID=65489 RepID=A0A0D3GK15_9ORYZ
MARPTGAGEYPPPPDLFLLSAAAAQAKLEQRSGAPWRRRRRRRGEGFALRVLLYLIMGYCPMGYMWIGP